MKRKKKYPLLHGKATKLRKPDPTVNFEANDAIIEDGDDFDSEGGIPEEFIHDMEPHLSHHTQRRQRNVNAWHELMPSLIQPLMAALHIINESSTDGVVEVEAFTCVSRCQITHSKVNIVSFGGV
jgi:hypothetical protein